MPNQSLRLGHLRLVTIGSIGLADRKYRSLPLILGLGLGSNSLVLMLLFHIIVFFLSPIVLTARISFHKVVEFVFIGYSVLFERRSHRASSQSRQHDAAR